MSKRKIHHALCHVIPPYILRHIADDTAHADLATRAGASITLERMHILAEHGPEALKVKRAATSGKRRNVYDARHRQSLPGKLVMNEKTSSSSDVEVTEAFDGAGKTWDFFSIVYARNSIDGKGLRLNSTVHYGKRFENAFWNGRQIVYGDGDGKLFNRFTAALDVIGHELTHGVTQYTAGLAYTGQTGALNEHISDVFGILVKQYALAQTAAQSDWIIGEGLFGPAVNGKGIRSMAAPGTAYDDPLLGRDPQPAHLRGYVDTSDDNGGVHINSGIPNHAFYLAATALGGPAWDVAGRIWYDALFHLPANPGFQQFADVTTGLAGMLFGANGTVQRAIQRGWAGVGVNPTGNFTPSVVRQLRRESKRRMAKKLAVQRRLAAAA
jgi:Zn-dependent metalloprotease